MADIFGSIRAGVTIYKVIESFFSHLYDEIGQVYIDMAAAQFKSAKQAIKAYKKSNNPETEIRVLLGHLRDAHNIYHKVVRRKKTEREFIFWSSTTKPHCTNENTLLVVHLATMISLIYKELDEERNAQDWAKKSIRNFKYHEKNYYPDYDELIKISSKYGYTERMRTSRYNYATYKYVSEKGKKFAQKRLRSQKKKLKKIFTHKS